MFFIARLPMKVLQMACFIDLELEEQDMRCQIGPNNINTLYNRAVQEFLDTPNSQLLYRFKHQTIVWIANRIDHLFSKYKNCKYATLNRVLVVIYYLAHSLSHTTLCDKFKIPRSSLNNILWTTMEILYNELSSEFIYLFNRPIEYFEEHSALFQSRYGLQNIFAAIDGTCIAVKAPNRSDWYSYINKDGIISMKTQVLVDFNYCILDICSGYPGGVHDAAVFEDSDFKTQMASADSFISTRFKFLADSAYPELPYIQKTGQS